MYTFYLAMVFKSFLHFSFVLKSFLSMYHSVLTSSSPIQPVVFNSLHLRLWDSAIFDIYWMSVKFLADKKNIIKPSKMLTFNQDVVHSTVFS